MKKRGKVKPKKINLKILFLSFLVVFLTAFIGSIFTSSQIDSDWYQAIKPSITPPNWVFPIVWNILFFLIALSLYLSLTKAKNKASKLEIKILFGINLFLNLLWSFLFFYLQNPLFAFFDLILLWISILIMISVTWRISQLSSWILIPYSLWIGFAGILNYLVIFG